MISIPDLISLVKEKVPDAEVNVLDKTGMKRPFYRSCDLQGLRRNEFDGPAQNGSGFVDPSDAGWKNPRCRNKDRRRRMTLEPLAVRQEEILKIKPQKYKEF